MVLRRIKARYTHGVLELEQPLGLEEGADIEVFVDEQVHATEGEGESAPASAAEEGASRERVTEAFRAAAGGWKGNSDPDELIRMLYEARITGSREAPNL